MENILFETTVPVLVTHLNYGNHLGYDAILSIIQDARMRWLKENNMGELSISKDVGYLVTKVELSYKSEAFHDDVLLIRFNIENLKKKSFEIHYEVLNDETDRLVATATTSHVFFDYKNKKIASTPENFINAIKIIESEKIV